MNKKFSTLLAGAALLVGAVSANAQGYAYSALSLDSTTVVDKLKANDNGLYQLSNRSNFSATSTAADSVLYMASNGVLQLVPAPISSDSLANTLWCVKIVASSNQGQGFAYDFYNKGTGQRLDVTMGSAISGHLGSDPLISANDSVVVGGEIAGWAFSGNYEKTLSQDNYLYSYFSKDSVVGLAVSGNVNGRGGVYLVKDLADNAVRQVNPNFKKFTLRKAAELVLSAEQINTLFGQQDADKGVALSFDPDVTVKDMKNPFANKDAKFIAEQVKGTSIADSAKYVYVLKSDSSYLKVDTALTNENGGAKFLAYGWTKLDLASRKTNATAQDSLNKSALKAQYQFLFTYKPSVDSLNIRVHRATFQKPLGTTFTAAGDTTSYQNAYVAIQDLVKGQNIRIITVDSVAQNTHIKFNYAGCAEVASDKTSVDNGLYVIKNKKGQVLAAPIHRNGNGRGAIEWVTLDAQDPEHMPAYQWVVGKTQAAASLAGTSPIRFINREFASLEDTLQLKKNDAGNIIAEGVLFNGLAMDEFTLTQITDSTIIKDTVLGYKYVKPVDLDITKYKFNYLHPYSQDKYIGMSKDSKDSALYVKDEMGAFTLEKGKYNTYGIDPATVNNYVPGLAQLHRMQYVITANNDTLVGNAKDQYTMGNVDKAVVDSFYFKANNFFGGKDYYAIVQASKTGNGIENAAQKAGVADDGMSAILKVQKLEETRTSAFTVEPVDAPLYRRFDSETLEGNKGDASDTLRFVEAYRGEVLQIEGNPSFKVPGVNMLGIYTADKAPSGLSFVVDTAWVTRGLGYIKPQYLISIDRHDYVGTAGSPCTESGPHVDKDGNITDAAHCVHATPAIPGFERGQYLVNFADSAAAYVSEAQNMYKWRGYDRVGFVEAIRVADTLYILRNEFKNLANDKIDFDAIKAADKAVTDKGGISYIHRLDNDKHKYVTWSMRFTDPETAGNEVEKDRSFLVESMKDAADKDIAPTFASWLKNQNGCLVMSNYDSNFNELATGGDDALIFNVKHIADDPIATDSKDITAATVSVVAGNGIVTINGAQGKKVVITNLLGQQIANTIVSSDKAEIAAPAGVVVVAVEGEAAVKAIVK